MALPLTVVDSTVLIDVLRGHRAALDWLLSVERELVASEVARVEILRGLRSRERGSAEQLFAAFRWVGVTETIARRAGELGREWRRSHGLLGVADLIIASTAIELEAELATSDARHFPMFAGLAAPYAD